MTVSLCWAHACKCTLCTPLRIMSGSVKWHSIYFTYIRNAPSLEIMFHYSHCTCTLREGVWVRDRQSEGRRRRVIGEKLSWFGVWLSCMSFGIEVLCYCRWLGPIYSTCYYDCEKKKNIVSREGKVSVCLRLRDRKRWTENYRRLCASQRRQINFCGKTIHWRSDASRDPLCRDLKFSTRCILIIL